MIKDMGKTLEAMQKWILRRMLRTPWTDKKTTTEVLRAECVAISKP